MDKESSLTALSVAIFAFINSELPAFSSSMHLISALSLSAAFTSFHKYSSSSSLTYTWRTAVIEYILLSGFWMSLYKIHVNEFI